MCVQQLPLLLNLVAGQLAHFKLELENIIACAAFYLAQ